MTTSPAFLFTFFCILFLFSRIAWGARGRARSASDFSVAGHSSGRWHVSGAIMGTLVGGASTIGTVQMAYTFGLSAWWFTLGAGLACFFMAVTLAKPLRASQVETVASFMAHYHGERARVIASLFSSLGMFIHIVAQLLACGAMLASLFPLYSPLAALLSAILIVLAAVGGGMRTAGTVGLFKLLLLYATMIGSGSIALRLVGGWQPIVNAFPAFPWFSLFGYGISEGLSDLLSMIVGVASTQTYLQAIFSARNIREARRGALISAFLIPPLGLCGVIVGLSMQLLQPGLDSAKVLPLFILEHFPPIFAGVAMATLLFAAVATAAGLAIGVGTTLQTDIMARLVPSSQNRLAHLRLLTLGSIITAWFVVMLQLDSLILRWSFLSMGLRGATLFVPLVGAIFLGKRTPPRAGCLAIMLGPTATVVFGITGAPFLPPLYLGLSLSALIMIIGFFVERTPRGNLLP